jgi:hypothetical protein
MVFASGAAAVACGGSSSDTVGGGGGNGDGSAGAEGSVGDDDGGAGDGAPVCTSGKKWTHGTLGSSSMQPGQTCIACHTKSGAGTPTFYVAGTVYPTAHEPDQCDGLASVTIEITDGNAKVWTLTSNAAGNFACGPIAREGFPACVGFAYPFTAKTINKTTGVTNAMINPVTSAPGGSKGDCNECHTVDGANNAPGRIMAP